MSSSDSQKALYGVEAGVILLAMPFLLFWPIVILPAILAMPALGLAIVGIAGLNSSSGSD